VPSTGGFDPYTADLETWTDDDWLRWLDTEVEPVDPEWFRMQFDLAGNQTSVQQIGRTVSPEVLAGLTNTPGFIELGPATRITFFESWYRAHPGPGLDETSRPDSGGWSHAGEEYFTTITLPDGSVVTEVSDSSGTTSRQLTDREKQVVGQLSLDREPLVEVPSGGPVSAPDTVDLDGRVALGGGGIMRLGPVVLDRRVLAALAVAAAIAAIFAVVALGGGGSEVPASGGGSETGSTSGSGTSGGGTSGGGTSGGDTSGGAAPGASAAAGDACEVAHGRQNIVQLTSPDVQPSIPRVTYVGDVAAGFPSPRFEWSEMPAETTEIAILVQVLTRDRGVTYQEDDRLWWNQRPSGATVWLVTGIDASARSLPMTSLAVRPPGDAVERKHENGRRTVDDQVYVQQFWVNSNATHLFTVFGLCDPPLAGTADDYNQVWLLRNAVAIGRFFSAIPG